MQVYRLEALSDNYIFLLHDPEQNIAAVVDPAEAQPVLKQLQKLEAELVAIFNTHHHSDHVGGNRQLMQHFGQVKVYGGEEDRGRIPGQQVFLKGGRSRRIWRSFSVSLICSWTYPRSTSPTTFTPMMAMRQEICFCGDTLFAGGCGRLFEGSPAQMVESLSKLQTLPDNTRVWCAHEYTLKNLQFALTVDNSNTDLQSRFASVKAARSQGQATVPSMLGVEKRTNPFLRWNQPTLQAAVQSYEPVQTFARLRGMKDRF